MYKIKGYGMGGGDKYFTRYFEAALFCEMMGISAKKIIPVM
jgi:hypothetical protein